MKEAHAIALFPGGFGTHDEGFEALTLIQTGRSEIVPVVFVDEPGGSYWREWERYVDSHLRERGLIGPDDLALFRVTDDVDVAVREIADFYRNYHSSRFVRDLLVLRLRVAPSDAELAALNDEFGDLLLGGRIESCGVLPEEEGEDAALPRLALLFNRRRVGLPAAADRSRQRLGDAARIAARREPARHHRRRRAARSRRRRRRV